jgi:hypothetical protein
LKGRVAVVATDAKSGWKPILLEPVWERRPDYFSLRAGPLDGTYREKFVGCFVTAGTTSSVVADDFFANSALPTTASCQDSALVQNALLSVALDAVRVTSVWSRAKSVEILESFGEFAMATALCTLFVVRFFVFEHVPALA